MNYWVFQKLSEGCLFLPDLSEFSSKNPENPSKKCLSFIGIHGTLRSYTKRPLLYRGASTRTPKRATRLSPTCMQGSGEPPSLTANTSPQFAARPPRRRDRRRPEGRRPCARTCRAPRTARHRGTRGTTRCLSSGAAGLPIDCSATPRRAWCRRRPENKTIRSSVANGMYPSFLYNILYYDY